MNKNSFDKFDVLQMGIYFLATKKSKEAKDQVKCV